MQNLLSQIDIGDLVALGASAVVVARVVPQIHVVGQRLRECEHGKHASRNDCRLTRRASINTPGYRV